MSTINDSDEFLVQRGTQSKKITAVNLMSKIEDTDLMLIQRGVNSYKVSCADVKAQLGSSGGGSGSSGGPVLPPYATKSGPEMDLECTDGTLEFSLDGSTYAATLNVPPETLFYVDWTDDIKTADHGTSYTASYSIDYPSLSTSETIDLDLTIDKMPDPFSFTGKTDVQTATEYTANTISPLKTINAPVSIWGSSNATSAQMAIADGPWESIPSVIDTSYVNRNQRIRIRHTTGTGSSTDYETTINIGYGTGAGEFETSTFTTTTEAVGVNAPVIGGDIGADAPSFPAFTGSAYAITGAAGTHASTDWQLATDAGFSSVVHQSLSDTTNLLSWTPYVSSSPGTGQSLGRLDGSTTYYVRARYRSSNGFESDWGDATLTSVALKEDFSNGTQEFGATNTTWTVPADVGRVRVTLSGSGANNYRSKGGTVRGHFKVMPGEKLQICNCNGAVGLWEFGYTTSDRGYAFAVAGNAGAEGYRHGDAPYQGYGAGGNGGGGDGGGAESDQGSYAWGGEGGTQNGPGAGGQGVNYDPEYSQPVHGSAGSGYSGGGGGNNGRFGDQYRGGTGGAGWYGGGGGGVAVTRYGAAGGGGGSNRWQTPTGAGWRNCTQLENSQGTSTTGAKIVIEY